VAEDRRPNMKLKMRSVGECGGYRHDALTNPQTRWKSFPGIESRLHGFKLNKKDYEKTN